LSRWGFAGAAGRDGANGPEVGPVVDLESVDVEPESVVGRLPDAMTIELRKRIRWSSGVGHHGDRRMFSQDSIFTRSTPLGVMLVRVPLAGIGAGSAAAITDVKLVRTLKATAKVLTILRIF